MKYEEDMFSTVVEIVGLEKGGRGCSCLRHSACGTCVTKQMALWVCKVIILNDKSHCEVALALYLLKYRKETCHVRFLRRHCIPFLEHYDRKILQVTNLLSGSNDYDNILHICYMHGAGEAFIIM